MTSRSLLRFPVMRIWLAAVVALFVGLLRPALAEGGLEKLEIATSDGARVFQVEVMRTEAERARGLMFRRYMPEDRGMLFDFKTEQQVTMWMKNTYLPLDMLFFSRDGRIVNIAANAEPMSETLIPSGAPAWAVLELNGGAAARFGLKVGDQARHSIFSR